MIRWLLISLLLTFGALTWLVVWPTLVAPAELRLRDIAITFVLVVFAAVLVAWRAQ